MGNFFSWEWWSPRKLYQPRVPAGRLMFLWGFYIYPMFIAFLIGIGLAYLESFLGYYSSSPLFDAFEIIMYPAMILAAILISIRRLKDLGKSGWYLLLAFIPLVNFLLGLWLIFSPGVQQTAASPESYNRIPSSSQAKIAESKFCSACGGEVKGRPQFCIHCGAMIPTST